jgi:NAD+-dependent protein deacetylase sirtuin 6
MRDKGTLNILGRIAERFYPTFTHYSITELVRQGLVGYVISTNMDALHARSGLPVHLLNEQHGNKHKERCERCSKDYYRQFDTLKTVNSPRGHLTGRNCTFCGERLRDSIVHFSEFVRPEEVMTAMYNSRKCDLAVVLGTSMNVQPAASFPDKCFKNGGKLVIINLQKTPFDSLASIRIFAKTDDVMRMLMEELHIHRFDVETDLIDTWDPHPDAEEEEESLLDYLGGLVTPSVVGFGILSFVCGIFVARALTRSP